MLRAVGKEVWSRVKLLVEMQSWLDCAFKLVDNGTVIKWASHSMDCAQITWLSRTKVNSEINDAFTCDVSRAKASLMGFVMGSVPLPLAVHLVFIYSQTFSIWDDHRSILQKWKTLHVASVTFNFCFITLNLDSLILHDFLHWSKVPENLFLWLCSQVAHK